MYNLIVDSESLGQFMRLKKLMTIGYEGSSVEDFLSTLTAAGVTTLLDIREIARLAPPRVREDRVCTPTLPASILPIATSPGSARRVRSDIDCARPAATSDSFSTSIVTLGTQQEPSQAARRAAHRQCRAAVL